MQKKQRRRISQIFPLRSLDRTCWPIQFARISATLAFATLALSLSSTALAGGRIFTIPGSGTAAGNTSITLDTRWVEGFGHHPIKLSVKASPIGSDRVFRLELETNAIFSGPTPKKLASTEIILPANQTTALAWLSIPQAYPWRSILLTTRINGRRVKELCGQVGLSFYSSSATDTAPHVLAVADALPDGSLDISTLGSLPGIIDPNIGPVWTQSVANFQNASANLSGLANTLAPTTSLYMHILQDLPPKWIHYDSLDMICLPLDVLEKLPTKNALAWDAIKQWVNTGGNLVITDMQPSVKDVNRVHAMLGWEHIDEEEGEGEADEPWTEKIPDWDFPDINRVQLVRIGNSTTYFGGRASDGLYQNYGDFSVQNQRQDLSTPGTVVATPFAIRSLGLGSAMMIPLPNPAKAGDDWNKILGAMQAERWSWTMRHGISMVIPNRSFWDFLVPGVGLVPLNGFRALITFFVILVGPVNFFWLRRKGKLHLLLFTVPAISFVICVSLITYAVLADGFALRVRARTYCFIDQPTGEATTWGRLSYYAGVAPSAGLTFPDDMVVYPIDAQPSAAGPVRAIWWNGGKQNLHQGWLNSRTPTQLLTVRTRKTQARLQVEQRAGKGEIPRVANELGGDIIQLVLRDIHGDWYRTANLPAGSVANLKPTSWKEMKAVLAKEAGPARPELPPGFQVNSAMNSNRNSYRYINKNEWQSPAISSSILERKLGRLSGIVQSGQGTLEPGTYLAIVRQSPEVVFGIEDFEEEASLHVIEGRW